MEHKQVIIHFRVTSEMMENLLSVVSLEKRADSTITISDIIRKSLENTIRNGLPQSEKSVNIDPELAKNMYAEIKRIGVNINQIATKINVAAKSTTGITESTLNRYGKSLNWALSHLLERLEFLEKNS